MIDLKRPVRRWVHLTRGKTEVALYGTTIMLRPKHSRVTFHYPLDRILVLAADAHQQREKARKKAERAARKGA